MTWFKERWLKVGIVLVIALVLGAAFYWFQYRPSKIRSRCLAEAEFLPAALLSKDRNEREDIIDDYYINCLRRFGLKE
ncbi:MAG: hypothetical protein A2831_02490 [Candidatus Yanofskybacteria bacterium RIFCSPHIGHO2_01_FULL_44_17]|uniref:Uncharacterized protein n=1 Tax=Candidatus Yanofskybacteria bacterium RIFCSPHIGHO2_01_FULL_44_17 TaxID=1802668 RepID=A0A1F8F0I5_9BACT|nr:MAG: hypothetical protein A2831_02490 [Candidatus Yanofskybacteria bacterium RIFCSPHIGHO2_01_FULL_44_17]